MGTCFWFAVAGHCTHVPDLPCLARGHVKCQAPVLRKRQSPSCHSQRGRCRFLTPQPLKCMQAFILTLLLPAQVSCFQVTSPGYSQYRRLFIICPRLSIREVCHFFTLLQGKSGWEGYLQGNSGGTNQLRRYGPIRSSSERHIFLNRWGGLLDWTPNTCSCFSWQPNSRFPPKESPSPLSIPEPSVEVTLPLLP